VESQSKIVLVSETLYEVVGRMTFETVPGLLNQSKANFSSVKSELVFDLEKVVHADSAGLALMLEWLRLASLANKTATFVKTPPQLLNLIEITGLSSILTLSQ
jgi:phospholipid transport system transporter-binding protein